MGALAIVFAVDVLISTLCIWLATKFSFVNLEIKLVPIIVLLASAVSLIPVIGWLAGFLLFVYLLMQLSRCSVVDALWVVLFTKLFSFVAILVTTPLFNTAM